MMKALVFLVAVLFLAAPASAQTEKRGAKEPDSARERAMKRCKENRGIKCDTAEGLSEWLREETPLTAEEQQAAAGARRHRETCAKNKKAQGC